ncbi:N-6 DNA methylase [Flavicella sp.]|uniref:N-6 DNA methylase n=1 Tax=Flavicella sp. TaxID=2957742 RepID=UPI00301A92A0
MLKTRDTPNELKRFNSLFSSFGYKYDLSRLFDDFLTIVICVFARQTEEELYFETIKGYTKKELNVFAKLLAELLIIYDKARKDEFWTDPLGTYYEVLASNTKKSGFGQFFTPQCICDLMSQFVLGANEWGKRINDPCSGSGRLILSANNQTEGNYYIAQDLDAICCKMTAINMCFHDIRGEVHHMNSLSNKPPRVSYSINYEFHKHKTPLILLKRPVKQVF